MLYNNFSGWLRANMPGKIKKICIDGGFTCPNRDGTCGTGGCIFCGERGAGDHLNPARSIEAQVRAFIAHVPDADGYIAYFQNFTNTYAPAEILRARYDAALAGPRVQALAVGTRPDCIDPEKAALLADYARSRRVWVELGLQTANDVTAQRINRGYPTADFGRAVTLLHQHGIPVVAHIIAGLPGEHMDDLKETVAYLNRFPLWGIKLHSIYVMHGTALEALWRSGAYTPPTMDAYTDAAVWVLTHIRPDMTVHRLTGDCPPGMLAAPAWNREKDRVIAEINRKLAAHGWRQGCLYRQPD